jgi:AAHS family 4-hydroxybenzoate transporter-like MFS transporter
MPSSSSPSVDVQSFLDEHRFSAFQWTIFALCFLIVLADGFDTAAIGFIAPSLLKEWGIDKPALKGVLSAALFGLAAGALSSGPLADRLGRKKLLVAAVGLFGLACLASAFSQSLEQLTTLRFVTGLGLGAAMPNAVTLMSEYCPARLRATLTNAMFCGFPLGAAFGGFLAAWMIPQFGWRSVLTLGGIAPLCLALAMALLLPESVRFMVARGLPIERIRAALARISASAAAATSFHLSESRPAAEGRAGIALVLSRPYVVGSVMLWVTYFMGLVIFYALINWMPILFKDAGLDPKSATLIAALFPLGGCGAVLAGWLMDRYDGNWIIAIGFAVTSLLIWLIGQVAGQVGFLVLVVFLGGAFMNTAQSSLPALAAAFYPTAGRATGVSWMLGFGRFGGIAGSLLVAELARRQFSLPGIFAVVALPGLVAALALLVKRWTQPAQAGNAPTPHPGDVVAH